MTAGQYKSRVIAVEEHFLTESYLTETAWLRVPVDEEPERAFMSTLPKNDTIRRRLTDESADVRSIPGLTV